MGVSGQRLAQAEAVRAHVRAGEGGALAGQDGTQGGDGLPRARGGVGPVAVVPAGHDDRAGGAQRERGRAAGEGGDRPQASASAAGLRTRETIAALRPILAGERAAFAGAPVRARGFCLREPLPGHAHRGGRLRPRDDPRRRPGRPQPRTARARARGARDDRRGGARGRPDAAGAGRVGAGGAGTGPAVTGPARRAARDLPGRARLRRELSAALGFGALAARARAGARRAELAPRGAARAARARRCARLRLHRRRPHRTYHRAGADTVGVAPSTAEDPRGSGVLAALSPTKELAP